MATALEQAKRDASTRVANVNRRNRTKMLESALVRKGTLITTAGIYGTMTRLGVPVSLGGFPWKLGVGALALLGEGLSRGAMQAIMAGIADSTLAIYVERSISRGTLIAGEDDDAGGEI